MEIEEKMEVENDCACEIPVSFYQHAQTRNWEMKSCNIKQSQSCKIPTIHNHLKPKE